MSKINETIVFMQNQIIALNDEIQSSKKMNISEIVGLIVSLLDNPKTCEIYSTTTNKTQGQFKCDICDFESKNENIMMSHMIDEHEDCYTCYLCNKYFETKHSLKHHNEYIHKEFSEMTESENDDNLPINSNERKHEQKLKKNKKSKKGGKK